MNEYEERARQSGKNVANDFTKALNSMSYEKEVIEEFVEEIATSHRTLQQSTMRGVFALIMHWAEAGEDGQFDARNEATVKFCQEIKKLALEQNACFPLI